MVNYMIKIWMDKVEPENQKYQITERLLDIMNPLNTQYYNLLDFNNFSKHMW